MDFIAWNGSMDQWTIYYGLHYGRNNEVYYKTGLFEARKGDKRGSWVM